MVLGLNDRNIRALYSYRRGTQFEPVNLVIAGTMECGWRTHSGGECGESYLRRHFDISRQIVAPVPPPAYQQRSHVKAPNATLAEIY